MPFDSSDHRGTGPDTTGSGASLGVAREFGQEALVLGSREPWNGTAFWLYAKRLERGTFAWSAGGAEASGPLELRPEERRCW